MMELLDDIRFDILLTRALDEIEREAHPFVRDRMRVYLSYAVFDVYLKKGLAAARRSIEYEWHFAKSDAARFRSMADGTYRPPADPFNVVGDVYSEESA